jgi:hypothetical protein
MPGVSGSGKGPRPGRPRPSWRRPKPEDEEERRRPEPEPEPEPAPGGGGAPSPVGIEWWRMATSAAPPVSPVPPVLQPRTVSPWLRSMLPWAMEMRQAPGPAVPAPGQLPGQPGQAGGQPRGGQPQGGRPQGSPRPFLPTVMRPPSISMGGGLGPPRLPMVMREEMGAPGGPAGPAGGVPLAAPLPWAQEGMMLPIVTRGMGEQPGRLGVALQALVGEPLQRIREKWQGVGEEGREPAQLPGVLRELGEEQRAQIEERGLGPMLLRTMPVPATGVLTARGRELLGQTAQLAEATWHDVGQLPVVGKPLRRLGALGSTAMELFNAAAIGTEAALARAVWMSPVEKPEAHGLPEEFRGKSWEYVMRATHPDVPPAAMDRYLWESGKMAWSGDVARGRALDRMTGGEDPEIVREGSFDVSEPLRAAAMGAGVMANKEGAWHLTEASLLPVMDAVQKEPAAAAYFEFAVNERMEQGEDEGAAAVAVVEELLNEGVPGESNPLRELVGQLIFDPTNLIGIGGKERRTGRFFRNAATDLAKLDDTPIDELFAATQKGKGGLLRLFERTPTTKQGMIIEQTTDLVQGVLTSLQNPDDRLRAIQALADLAGDPDDAARALDALTDLGWGRQVLGAEEAGKWGLKAGDVLSPLESANGKRVTYFLRQMFTNPESGVYDPAGLGRALREAETAEDAVGLLLNRMTTTAAELYPGKKAGAVVRANNSVRGFFAKYFHLGFASGYAVRNGVQNLIQGAIDGVLTFDGPKKMTGLFDAVGYKPAAALRRMGAGGPAGEFAALRAAKRAAEAGETATTMQKAGRVVKEGPAIWLSGKIEQWFGERAVYTGIKNTFNSHWRVGRAIPAEDVARLTESLGDDGARLLLGDVLQARNPRQLDEAVKALKQQSGYVELWRSLDPEILRQLDELGAADEVLDLVKSARSPEAFSAGVKKLVAAAWARGDELGDLIPKGSVADEMMTVLDEGIQAAGGLQHPLTPKGYEEGKEWLAVIGRQIYGSQNRAAYYASKAGMGDEFIGTYVDVEKHRGQVAADVRKLRDYTVKTYLSGKLSKAEQATLWQHFFDFADDASRGHFRYATDAFDKLAELASGAERVDDATEATVLQKIAAVIDDGHAPTGAEISNAAAVQLEDLLHLAEQDVTGRWGQTGGRLSKEQLTELGRFVEALKPRLNAMRGVAAKVGEAVRDFAYHNYSDRRNVDTALGLLFQYPYWYSRTYPKWLVRAVDQPHVISAYFKAKDALHQINADLPEWWQDQIKIGEVAGEGIYLPLEATVNPLAGLVDQFRSEERERVTIAGLPVGKWVQEAGVYGPSTNVLFSFALAVAAYAQGDVEAAKAWAGYQSQWSRVLPGATAALREIIPGAEQVIPPGGVGLEPWQWEMTEEGPRYGGSLYDKRRVGSIIADMVMQGQISPAEADLAAYFGTGEVYDEAMQQQALGRFMPTIVAWAGGPGVKPREEYEVELSRVWDAVNALRENREEMTPEAYNQAWRDLRERYPFFNSVMMSRAEGGERDEALVWSVINRLPPGWKRQQVFEDAHVEDLLGQFYEGRGDMSAWSADDRREFMAAVIRLAGELEYPSEEEAGEWEEVRALDVQLREQTKEQFGEDVFDVESEYYSLRDGGASDEELAAFREEHPQLAEMWQFREEQREGEPLLAKYYERPPEEWKQADAADAFFELYFESVPPGAAERKLREEVPLLGAMRDYDTRKSLEEEGFTVEQYKEAMALVQQWAEDNPDLVSGDAEEWAEARELNQLRQEEQERLFPGIGELLGQYTEASITEREALRERFPELEQYWEWEDTFGEEHPLWKRYYQKESSAFWEFLNEALPPGRLAQGAREHTLVQLVLDAETRGTATPEQYEKALAFLEEWKAEHFDPDVWLTPEDWAAAREQNEQFEALRDEHLPGIEETLSEYYELSSSERKAFREEHPEIDDYYDLREWFGEQPGNELWKYFYLGEETYKGGAGTTKKKTTYRRGGGGRGYGSKWSPFAEMAKRTPKVFLETPKPWEGALRLEKPYRAERTPWLVKRLPWAK